MRPRDKAAAGRISPRGAAVRACASFAPPPPQPQPRRRGEGGGGGLGKPGAASVRRPARADLCAARKIGAYCRPLRPAAGQSGLAPPGTPRLCQFRALRRRGRYAQSRRPLSARLNMPVFFGFAIVRRRRRPYDVCLHPPRFERLLRLLFRRRQPVLPRRGRSPCARPALKSLGRPPAHARREPPARSPRPRRLRAGACSGRRGGRGRIRPPARIRRRRPAGRRCRGGFSRPPERGAVRSVARGRRRLELRDGPPRGASRGRRRRIRPPARIRRRRPSSSKSRCWGGG